MNARELLLCCRSIVKEIKAIEEQIKRIGTIGGPREKTTSIIAQGSIVTNRPDAALNQKIDAYEQALADKKCKAVELLLQFENLLDSVPDVTDRAILRYYYGAGWTDERIADEMELTDRTVRTRRKRTAEALG